jgi:pyruvate dehydrogenase E2 component (dihydrolipoamide acetyltransferase)
MAKKLAAENKIDLADVTGTGPGGRILEEDVVAFIQKLKSKPAEEPKVEAKPEPKKTKVPVEIPGMPAYTDIELTNYKRVTAERLTEAKQTVPHFYVSVECEVDKLLALRSQLNKVATTKITINDMLIKACSLACLKIPVTNSSWMGDFVRRYKDVDMSVAVQTPNGLITPIVPRANLKGFEQIAKATKELVVKAKDGTLKPEEFIGGTFTISNAGMYGISQLIPIVNPPQACILGVSAVEKKVVVDESKTGAPLPWRIASKMTVTLSCDHRVVDGAGGAEWTQEFKKLIENPALMML